MALPVKINALRLKEHGEVIEIKQDIAHIIGLANCINGQAITVGENGTRGVVVGYDRDHVLALIIQHHGEKTRPGERVYSTIDSFTIPVGSGFIGRTVNGLAQPVDGRNPIPADALYPIFGSAPGVLEREPLSEALETGVKIVDMMNPVGKGQRQLILGDRSTGKTAIALDAILNQRGKEVLCIYCCIGKAETSLAKVADLFAERGVMEYTTIVAATASDPVGQQYLAPYVAASIGEYFMNEKRRDVLVVFDDLTKHAWVYRQMSLLLGRSPGRDAYPGDIFYLHSQLVERACRLGAARGGGSMTFLPIVETVQGDVTGYIPTNIISMTDGQLYVSTPLFSEGFKPAIDIGLSVSRIGNKVQWPAMRSLAGILRLEYIQYKELEKLTRIKAGVSQAVERRLKKGRVVAEILKQGNNDPVPIVDQVLVLYALTAGVMDHLEPAQVSAWQKGLAVFIRRERPELLRDLETQKKLTPEIKEALNAQLAAYGGSAL
jgi:F-type H+-transporting ATPase subunit alpha